ncbi:MAG: rhodanese-like domain-containing protein, partial [Flavobacteriales bacterium]|nr:rhodanese-like domain-containing protein [Flavobacteriales bacterium]
MAVGSFSFTVKAQSDAAFSSLPVKEFMQAQSASKGLLLDVRTPDECEAGIIEGATMLDYSAPGFMDGIKKLDKDRPVYIYCASGGRSRQTMTRMKGLGFTKERDLEAGMSAWLYAGQPTLRA